MELRATRHIVTGAEGCRMNVWDYGGEGPPVLLIHCTGGVARMWDPIAEQLLPRFRVLAYDTRGQGDSDPVEAPEEYAWPLSGRDVLAVIDQMNLGGEVRAVGHSAGAAHIAYAEHFRPGTFPRAVLIDAIIGPREVFAGERPLAVAARRRINEFESLQEAYARYTAKPPMSRWDERVVQAYIEHGFRERDEGGVALKTPGTKEAWIYNAGGACDLYETMGSFSPEFAPLCLTAEGSNVAPLAHMQAQGFPGATLQTIEGDVSHFIPQEQPEDVAEIILNWFAG